MDVPLRHSPHGLPPASPASLPGSDLNVSGEREKAVAPHMERVCFLTVNTRQQNNRERVEGPGRRVFKDVAYADEETVVPVSRCVIQPCEREEFDGQFRRSSSWFQLGVGREKHRVQVGFQGLRAFLSVFGSVSSASRTSASTCSECSMAVLMSDVSRLLLGANFFSRGSCSVTNTASCSTASRTSSLRM